MKHSFDKFIKYYINDVWYFLTDYLFDQLINDHINY